MPFLGVRGLVFEHNPTSPLLPPLCNAESPTSLDLELHDASAKTSLSALSNPPSPLHSLIETTKIGNMQDICIMLIAKPYVGYLTWSWPVCFLSVGLLTIVLLNFYHDDFDRAFIHHFPHFPFVLRKSSEQIPWSWSQWLVCKTYVVKTNLKLFLHDLCVWLSGRLQNSQQ